MHTLIHWVWFIFLVWINHTRLLLLVALFFLVKSNYFLKKKKKITKIFTKVFRNDKTVVIFSWIEKRKEEEKKNTFGQWNKKKKITIFLYIFYKNRKISLCF